MRLEASTGVSSCVENPCPPGIAFPVEQGPGRTECCRHPGVVERPEMGATENPELSRGSQGPSRGLTRLDTPAHGVHTHAHLPMPRAPRSTLQASSRRPRPPGPGRRADAAGGPRASMTGWPPVAREGARAGEGAPPAKRCSSARVGGCDDAVPPQRELGL